MSDVMEGDVVASVWSDRLEYVDERCSAEVSSEYGVPQMIVSLGGRDALLQFEFSRDGALDMAEAFLRAARHG